MVVLGGRPKERERWEQRREAEKGALLAQFDVIADDLMIEE